MMRDSSAGLTLAELLISVALIAIITSAVAALLDSGVAAYSAGQQQIELQEEGIRSMEAMTQGLRLSTRVFAPNAHAPSQDVLAFAGFENDDEDSYFNDPLFPRVDEDPRADITKDNRAGLKKFDDNGDGLEDVGVSDDDDEDVLANEDPVDGEDNDGDGNMDEDPAADVNGDGSAGVAGFDDDGDGAVDEGDTGDDDEDGSSDEDDVQAACYQLEGNGLVLYPPPDAFDSTPIEVAPHATAFSAVYEAPSATHGARIQLTLVLTGDDGAQLVFSEYAFPRNIHQRNGKRVR